MGASGPGEARRTDAAEFPSVVAATAVGGAIYLDASGAVFAWSVLASLAAQFAETSVVANRTLAYVGAGRRRLLLGDKRETFGKQKVNFKNIHKLKLIIFNLL